MFAESNTTPRIWIRCFTTVQIRMTSRAVESRTDEGMQAATLLLEQSGRSNSPAGAPRHRVEFPEWLDVDAKNMKGTFKAMPQRSELPSNINESLVVELYSK